MFNIRLKLSGIPTPLKQHLRSRNDVDLYPFCSQSCQMTFHVEALELSNKLADIFFSRIRRYQDEHEAAAPCTGQFGLEAESGGSLENRCDLWMGDLKGFQELLQWSIWIFLSFQFLHELNEKWSMSLPDCTVWDQPILYTLLLRSFLGVWRARKFWGKTLWHHQWNPWWAWLYQEAPKMIWNRG